MFDNIIENTKRNISSATLMAIAITILESYFLIKGNFPISYTILCAILFYVGWVVFCSIALSILKTIIALILWIIEEIKKPQTCTNQEVKPSELPHRVYRKGSMCIRKSLQFLINYITCNDFSCIGNMGILIASSIQAIYIFWIILQESSIQCRKIHWLFLNDFTF